MSVRSAASGGRDEGRDEGRDDGSDEGSDEKIIIIEKDMC